MRHVFILAALLARLAGGLAAQSPTYQHSLDTMTRSLFERLDKSELNSGILFRQIFLSILDTRPPDFHLKVSKIDTGPACEPCWVSKIDTEE